MEVNSTPGAESTSLDAWGQKVRGEKALQEKWWGKKNKESVLVQWRRKRETWKGRGSHRRVNDARKGKIERKRKE